MVLLLKENIGKTLGYSCRQSFSEYRTLVVKELALRIDEIEDLHPSKKTVKMNRQLIKWKQNLYSYHKLGIIT